MIRATLSIDLQLDSRVLEVLARRRGVTTSEVAAQLAEELAGLAADAVAWRDAVDRPAGVRASAQLSGV